MSVYGTTQPGKRFTAKAGIEPRCAAREADASTRPAKRYQQDKAAIVKTVYERPLGRQAALVVVPAEHLCERKLCGCVERNVKSGTSHLNMTEY